MHPRSQILRLRVFPLSLRLRKPFKHAAHVRHDADPVVVQVELGSGSIGYGETLPRPYVSGETVGSVVGAIKDVLIPELLNFHPDSFAEALELIDGLPWVDEHGDALPAARAAVELALIDAYCRHYHKSIGEVVGWFGVPGLGSPGSVGRLRYSAVLAGEAVGRLGWAARLMRWYGLRDFKLKVGFDDDVERIRAVAKVLGRSLGKSTTLRLDANGAWDVPRAVATLQAVRDVPIACVEQPLPKDCDADLPVLRRQTDVPIMLDESLVMPDDAERLWSMGVLGGLNVRIAKNGGLLPALRLAHFARRHGLLLQLGCLVGETSILSGVGRRFLEEVPGVRFAEGSYGKHLLTHDIVPRPLTFGLGGRVRSLPGPGWGVAPDPVLLERYARPGVVEFPF